MMSQQDETRNETEALNLTVEDAPNEADIRFVEERIIAYNVAATGYDDYCPLALFVRNDQGAIIAGLAGFTWGRTLKIELLWVHETLRGQGYASRLVETAEREAVARGCQHAVLDTHSFHGRLPVRRGAPVRRWCPDPATPRRAWFEAHRHGRRRARPQRVR
ncbi:MAG TPA: GNAT family N-acetyltransferase, partial [Sideroxyarcus sp.]|nr:GNAT family N-acetyltransferase [Sideroxyarcus sp.]